MGTKTVRVAGIEISFFPGSQIRRSGSIAAPAKILNSVLRFMLSFPESYVGCEPNFRDVFRANPYCCRNVIVGHFFAGSLNDLIFPIQRRQTL